MPEFPINFWKAQGTRTIIDVYWITKNAKKTKNKSICASVIIEKSLIVLIFWRGKMYLEKQESQKNLIVLIWNLYTGQDAILQTEYRIFGSRSKQRDKNIRSHLIYLMYAKYILRETSLSEVKGGFKFYYAGDTNLIAKHLQLY